MSSISTNILDPKWNADTIEQEYQIYEIHSQSKKYWRGLNRAADKVFDQQNVLSACYFGDFEEAEEDRKTVYLLLRRGDRNDELMVSLIDLLNGDSQKDEFTLDPIEDIVSFIESHERVMLQLLINALQSDLSSDYSFNNLSGKFYRMNSGWIKGKGGSKTLEFKVENAQGLDELVLAMHVHSFNEIFRLKLSDDKLGKVMSGPQYMLDGLQLRRAFNSDINNFVMKPIGKNRSTISFMKFDGYDEFRESKAGYFFSLLDLFNAKYGSSSKKMMCNIDLKSIEETGSRKFTSKKLKEMDEWICGQISGQKINVVDLVCDEDSATFMTLLEPELKEHKAIISTPDEPIPGESNICIIHDSEYYEEHDNQVDPHDKYKELGVQHIVVEHEEKDIKRDLMVVIKELTIKKDLVRSEKHISVDDWSSHGFDSDLTFIQIESVSDGDNEDSKRNLLYAMTVRPDGSFDIDGKDVTDDPSNEYLKLWNRNKDDAGGTIEGMVADGRGNINVIKHSNIITVPDKEAIQALKAGMTIRRNEHKYGSLRGLLDLRMLRYGDKVLYYSGFKSFDLQPVMKTAPNLRIVEAVKGELFFDDLIELMNVPFVKYKMFTVKPYPFKYLDEYKAMRDIEKSTKEEGGATKN